MPVLPDAFQGMRDEEDNRARAAWGRDAWLMMREKKKQRHISLPAARERGYKTFDEIE